MYPKGISSLQSWQIASAYEIIPKNLINWKKQFLENMSLAFDKSVVVKEYKEKIEDLEKSNDNLAKKVGNLTIEKDFLEGKLVSLVSSKERKVLIDTKHNLSLNKQCRLLHVSKSFLYYQPTKPFSTGSNIKLLDAINNIYSDFPSYGYRRTYKQLLRDGYDIGKKFVKKDAPQGHFFALLTASIWGLKPSIQSLRQL